MCTIFPIHKIIIRAKLIMTHSQEKTPEQSTLGKKTTYDVHYNPEQLFPITRSIKREQIGIKDDLPFFGYDLWNHYEVSWLNNKGKPIVALAEIIYPCESPNIIESKSMKLYFNSFNNTVFDSVEKVSAIVSKDIAERIGHDKVVVNIIPVSQFNQEKLARHLPGICIDELDIDCNAYHASPDLLQTTDEIVEETLCSDLLKSNCLVTNQPDWCSVQITYKGYKIDRENLLRYLVSFRNDNEFHEQCIEKIFMQIMQHCKPKQLTVWGRSTRRGGLDINSYRSTSDKWTVENLRLCRQ